MTDYQGPLAGIRVVEFTNLIAGPHAGMLLADLGADVIKVEPPGGDLGRGFGPYVDGQSAFFVAANRGKRSVVLDLRTDDGKTNAFKLASEADVVLHNLRAGAMERAGLGEAEIRAANPGVIYAVVSAFAPSGPEAHRSGIDVVFQAEAGMVAISGERDGPMAKTATTIGDYTAAIHAALAICAALVERASTGIGRRIDTSLRDGIMTVQGGWNALAFATGTQPAKRGTASPYLAPNQVFATSDGHIALAIVSERHWLILCETLGRPDLAERFPDNDSRMAEVDELAADLDRVFGGGTTEHWVDVLTGAGLPAGKVRSLLEAFEAAPHMRHDGGVIPVTGSAISIDGVQIGHPDPAPALGAHTGEILG